MSGVRAARALRPDHIVYDLGSNRWRGGRVQAIDGDTYTLRIQAEMGGGFVRDVTCDVGLVPAGARTLGAPIAARVTGAIDALTVEDVVGSSWPGANPVHDEAGAVAAGLFTAAIVPRHIHHEPDYYPW
jgi:hypothetical protein